jgi:hypothetical protein
VRPIDEKIEVTSRKLSRLGTVCSQGSRDMSFRHGKIAQSAGTASLESRLPSIPFRVRFSQVSRAGAALERRQN